VAISAEEWAEKVGTYAYLGLLPFLTCPPSGISERYFKYSAASLRNCWGRGGVPVTRVNKRKPGPCTEVLGWKIEGEANTAGVERFAT